MQHPHGVHIKLDELIPCVGVEELMQYKWLFTSTTLENPVPGGSQYDDYDTRSETNTVISLD